MEDILSRPQYVESYTALTYCWRSCYEQVRYRHTSTDQSFPVLASEVVLLKLRLLIYPLMKFLNL